MKAYPYLNNGEDHWRGFKPEHAGDLRLGAVQTLPDLYNTHDALELVWQVCNGADPQSEVLWYMFGNRSLSVGDVVVLESDGAQEAFACDAVGWTKLPRDVVRVVAVQIPNHVVD